MENNDLAMPTARAVAATPSSPSVSPVPASIPIALRSAGELSAMAKPWTAKELAALSEWYFGVPLSLSRLNVGTGYADYTVAEKYNSYHGKGRLHSEHCTKGYDYSRAFWQHVIGELYCGGIAQHSYGQTRFCESEQSRMLSLCQSVKAQGMAARSDETGTGSAVGNSPVGNADAPEPSRLHTSKGI